MIELQRMTTAATSCPFCEIAAERATAHVVLEDADFIAFLDSRPVFLGHVLVVPRQHVLTLGELEPPMFAPLLANVQRIMGALERALHADGTFVATNNKVSQSVPHMHFHVIPRKNKDGLRGFFWPRQKYPSDEAMAEMAKTIRAAMG